MLNRLYEAHVFTVGPAKGGKIGIVEECDCGFGDSLTPDEVRQLARELLEVANDAPST